MASLQRRLAPVVTKAMKKFNVPGVSVGVILDGEEQYVSEGVTSVEFPLDVDERTMFQIGSTTKTYTATALMTLVEEGKVNLEDKVTKYLPKFKLGDAAALKQLTVRHLVTHTGGFLGDYFDDLGRGDDALRRKVGRMRTKTPQLTPVGKLMSYNNAGFYVLGRLVEEVSGQRYEDLIQQRILDPLEMNQTFWFAEDVFTYKTALGHELKLDGSAAVARPWGLTRGANPAGGIASTAVDQMKYARFHLGMGPTAKDKRVLKQPTIRQMQKPLAKVGFGMCDNVGVSWLLDDYSGTRVVKHGGSINGHMSEFVLVPSKGFGVTVLTNGQRGHEVGTAVIKWCLGDLLGLKRAEHEVKAIKPAEAAAYTGRYPVSVGDYVVTTENGGLLVTFEVKKEVLEADPEVAAQLPPPFPLGFVGKDRAVVQGDYNAGARVQFFRDDNGDVEWMRTSGRIYKRQPLA
jgi:CubicO group peptidase (beta-lactamase class C family)